MIAILSDGEEHIDWLETELDLNGQLGIQSYLQTQLKDAETKHDVDLKLPSRLTQDRVGQ